MSIRNILKSGQEVISIWRESPRDMHDLFQSDRSARFNRDFNERNSLEDYSEFGNASLSLDVISNYMLKTISFDEMVQGFKECGINDPRREAERVRQWINDELR